MKENKGLSASLPGSLIFGVPGADGKSAYEYAKDGGYAGTEEEFADLMANGARDIDYFLVKELSFDKETSESTFDKTHEDVLTSMYDHDMVPVVVVPGAVLHLRDANDTEASFCRLSGHVNGERKLELYLLEVVIQGNTGRWTYSRVTSNIG